MSYAVSAALQAAIHDRLSGDLQLSALTDGAIHDALPPGPLPDLYIVLGPEQVRDRSDISGRGAEHDLVISVVTGISGFSPAKMAAAAISDALLGAPLELTRGRVVMLDFLRARAARKGGQRQIDMTFRARVEDDRG